MRGGCSFYDALAKRLQLIQPTVEMVTEYLRIHPPRFTPGIKQDFLLFSNQLDSHSLFLDKQRTCCVAAFTRCSCLFGFRRFLFHHRASRKRARNSVQKYFR